MRRELRQAALQAAQERCGCRRGGVAEDGGKRREGALTVAHVTAAPQRHLGCTSAAPSCRRPPPAQTVSSPTTASRGQTSPSSTGSRERRLFTPAPVRRPDVAQLNLPFAAFLDPAHAAADLATYYLGYPLTVRTDRLDQSKTYFFETSRNATKLGTSP